MRRKDWDRVAENYHDEIISPFQKGVKNPLFRKLGDIKDAKSKVVADIGCGRGEITDFLAFRFRMVYCIDFSPAMLRAARKQSARKNVSYAQKDMRDLSAFSNSFDVVVAANSVVMPKIKDVKQSLRSIASTLKEGGDFFGVFPAMDTTLYQGFLILEEQLEKHGDEQKAVQQAKRILERPKYDFIAGTFDDDGQMQKFYYDFELKQRLQEAGLKSVQLGKVLYPWGEDISSYEDFPGKPWMWDWFVSAKK